MAPKSAEVENTDLFGLRSFLVPRRARPRKNFSLIKVNSFKISTFGSRIVSLLCKLTGTPDKEGAPGRQARLGRAPKEAWFS